MTLTLAAVPPARARAAERRMILSICLAAAVLPLTFTGGTLVMPALAEAFGQGGPALAWVVNAFMLVFGALPLVAGNLADRLGRRRVFRWGLAGFVVSGGLLALAPGLLVIDLLRGLQGLFAAAVLAAGGALLAQIPAEAARRQAFALLGATFGLGLAAGPLVAGGLLALSGWRGVFLGASGLAGIALVAGLGALRESRNPPAARFDAAGAALFAASLALLTGWAVSLPGWGLGALRSWGLLAGALACLVAFARVEARVAAPMFDLRLLADRAFLGVQALPLATCLGFVALLVIVPVQRIGAGDTPLAAALLSLALSGPVFLVPLVLARLPGAPRGRLVVAGLVLAALGLFALGCTDLRGARLPLVGALALVGLGTGLPWGLMDGLAIELAPRDRAGAAAGLFATTRVASEGIVLALVAATQAGLIAAIAHLPAAQAAAIVTGGAVPPGAEPALAAATGWLFRGLGALTLLAALLLRRALRSVDAAQ